MGERRAALVETYQSLGVGRGRTVLVAANFAPMLERADEDRAQLLADHYGALRDAVGPGGTIVVPTATLNLCNTDVTFDPRATPSHQMGAFSEYVRQLPEAHRSFHPFWSLAATGADAERLTGDVSRHAFGVNSVWSRLVEADAIALHVGVHPRLSTSINHHVELVCGVPYRYTKEFLHPVARADTVLVEPFYHFCTYLDADLVRDGNRRLFAHYSAGHEIAEARVARGTIWSLRLADYFRSACSLVSRQLYAWLEREPARRPWQR